MGKKSTSCLYPSDEVVKSGLFLGDDIIDIRWAEIKSLFWTESQSGLFFLVLNDLWEPKQFVSVVVQSHLIVNSRLIIVTFWVL